jgi:hypothetical protein
MKNKLFLLVLPLIFFAASCSKQPSACFTASKTSVDVGESVTFSNCATDASSYEWDFGDGAKSNEESASHSWTKPGVYVVQLKTLSKDKKKLDKYSVAVTVNGNNRYLTKVVLKKYAEKKSDGSVWDTPSVIPGVTINPEADIFVRISLAAGGWSFNTSTKNDIKNADLPFTWNLSQQNLFMAADSWNVDVRDEDNFGASSESMNLFFVANPATAGSEGKIVLTDNASLYELEVYYENR